jgi:DNA repair exonuclease SbcCD ATPase subunit
MIKLLKLRFAGIGRFVKEQEISFANREKIIQVDGKNLNTGGSSGAAKSTVFHAIDYLFGLNDISAKDLQSRVGKTKLFVEGTFDIDGVTVIITRGKDGLTLLIGEESISGNVKLAEERLSTLIGIPEKLFKKMIHKKQKEGGFFLKMTSGDQYKFLIKVLGLEHWLEKIAQIDKNITAIEKSNASIKLNIASIKSSIEDTERSLSLITQPVIPTTSQVYVEELKNKIEEKRKVQLELEKELETGTNLVQSALSEAVAAIPLPVPQTGTADTSGIAILKENLAKKKQEKSEREASINESKNQTQKQINNMNSQVFAIGAAKKDMAATVENINALKAEKAHIEAAQCPTCAQTWVGDSASIKIDKINRELIALAEKAYECHKIVAEEPRTLEALQVVNDRMKELQLENTKAIDDEITAQTVLISEEQGKIDNYLKNINIQNQLKQTEYQNQTMAIKSEYNEKLNAFRLKYADKLNLVKAEIQNDLNECKANETELNNYGIAAANYVKSTTAFKQSIEDKKAKLAEEENKDVTNAKAIAVAEETKRLIRNYTLQIFQESLDYIGEQATQILSKIPNMANSSIYFESCRETGKGMLKDEVNAILNMDGENEINIKTLSGGEETAAELAVDLAVIEMIEDKTGKGADFCILDEPFTGLDSVNIQNVMDMLIELDTDKKIIIVDHNPEIKALINDRITVVRNGEESVIE